MELYVLRHAESNGNATGDCSTDNHDQLSAKGWEQARALVPRLQAIHFDKIYCSALQRTQETISPYLQAVRRQGKVWSLLGEGCHHQDVSGGPDPDGPREAYQLPAHVAENFTYRDQALDLSRPSGDELYGHGLFRVEEAARIINADYREHDQSILLVSHGIFLSMFLDALLGMPPQRAHLRHDNTGLSHLRYEGNRWNVHYLNRI